MQSRPWILDRLWAFSTVACREKCYELPGRIPRGIYIPPARQARTTRENWCSQASGRLSISGDSRGRQLLQSQTINGTRPAIAPPTGGSLRESVPETGPLNTQARLELPRSNAIPPTSKGADDKHRASSVNSVAVSTRQRAVEFQHRSGRNGPLTEVMIWEPVRERGAAVNQLISQVSPALNNASRVPSPCFLVAISTCRWTSSS